MPLRQLSRSNPVHCELFRWYWLMFLVPHLYFGKRSQLNMYFLYLFTMFSEFLVAISLFCLFFKSPMKLVCIFVRVIVTRYFQTSLVVCFGGNRKAVICRLFDFFCEEANLLGLELFGFVFSLLRSDWLLPILNVNLNQKLAFNGFVGFLDFLLVADQKTISFQSF